MESLARAKNACDTVVAAFFEVNHARYHDAFHPQSRSHRTIAALGGWLICLCLKLAYGFSLNPDLDDTGSVARSKRQFSKRFEFRVHAGFVVMFD